MKKLIIIACLTILGSTMYAQQEPHFNQYNENILYYNPAYAGSRGNMNITAMHRQQWIGIKGAPMSQTFFIHSPLQYESVGLGFSMINDRLGPLNQTWLNGDFSYTFKLKRKRKLAFGLKAGVNILNGDLQQLYTLQENDPSLQYNYVNVIKPNVGFGAYYHTRNWYIGFSVPKIWQSFNFLGVDQVRDKRHYYLMAGGIYKVNRRIKLRPSTMLKITPGAPLRLDLSNAIIFYDKLWLVGNYALLSTAGASVQVNLNPQFKVGYSFEISTSKIARYNYGTHELLLSYDFVYKHRMLASPRFF